MLGFKKRIIAIASGKGGVGKTNFSVNFSITLGKLGYKTILLDADFGGTNVEQCAGIKAQKNLDDFFYQKTKDLVSIVSPTPYKNLGIIAGTTSTPDVANPKYQQKKSLIFHMEKLNYDVLILDLGAGTDLDTLDLYLTADHHFIVTNTEQTSIKNAYDLIKAILYRMIIQNFRDNPIIGYMLKKTENILVLYSKINNSNIDDRVKKLLIYKINQLIRDFIPTLILNRVKDRNQSALNGEIIKNIFYNFRIFTNVLLDETKPHAFREFLDSLQMDDMAKFSLIEKYTLQNKKQNNVILEDPAVAESVAKGEPFAYYKPKCNAVQCIETIAEKIGLVQRPQ